jgi:hypothetical protein
MKVNTFNSKFLFTVLLIAGTTLLSSVIAKAQTADSTRTAEGRASALTEKMKTELSLTATQYPQVQAINLKYAQKNEEIFKGSEGKFAKFKALKASQKGKSREMKAVLDKDQFSKYEEMMEEMKNKAKEGYKNRQGAGG